MFEAMSHCTQIQFGGHCIYGNHNLLRFSFKLCKSKGNLELNTWIVFGPMCVPLLGKFV